MKPICIKVSVAHRSRPDKTRTRYPPSTTFTGGIEDFAHTYIGGYSFIQVLGALKILADVNNALERGDDMEVR